MAPSLAHPVARALNMSAVALRIGGDVGNWRTSTSGDCAVGISWASAVAPVEISVVNGSRIAADASYWNPLTVMNATGGFEVLERIGTFNSTQGDRSWPVNSTLLPGAIVALQARDGSGGGVALSQLRTIYEAGTDDVACRNVAAETELRVQGIRVTAQRGNWYRPSTEYPCTPVTITYGGLAPPANLELFDAAESPSLDRNIFFPRAVRRLANVTFIRSLATLNNSAGSYDWTIPSDFPLGSRVGVRITDSLGNTGLSEVRFIYPTSEQTIDVCRTPTSRGRAYLDRPIVQFGLFLSGLIMLVFLLMITTCCCRTCRRRQVARTTRTAVAPQTSVGAIGYPLPPSNGPNDIALHTYRHRTEEEEDLPPYEQTPSRKVA